MDNFTQFFAHEIIKIINILINKASYDKTTSAVVTEIIKDNTYKIKISGLVYTARSHFKHNIGDIVYVTIAQNNYNNIFILY